MLLSDFLDQNGFESNDSEFIKQHGDVSLSGLSEDEQGLVLKMAQGEKQFKTLQGKVQRDDLIREGLLHFVEMRIPKASLNKTYQHIYKGFITNVADHMFNNGEYDIHNGEVFLMDNKPEGPKPKNELERLLSKAKISLNNEKKTVQDIFDHACIDTRINMFLK